MDDEADPYDLQEVSDAVPNPEDIRDALAPSGSAVAERYPGKDGGRLIGAWKHGSVWYQSEKDFGEVPALAGEHLEINSRYGFINTMAKDGLIVALDDRMGKSFRWYATEKSIGFRDSLVSELDRPGVGVAGGIFTIHAAASMEEVLDVRERGKAPPFLRMPESGYWYETKGD